ncbi:hypothetical protein KFK09_009580 [Dendrobium nobile]|uniref:Uncharacterized protein n=1 Tax=Dendrobium nobile TaxID=94219 RepID=A0A8T3BKC8_DENNO|nr:hypothetical protein KFK09_009580 [Dendrobium nobile]
MNIIVNFMLKGYCCFLADSKGYIVDDDGIDFVKFSHLRDIKAQQRSLRYKPPPCSR